MRSIEEIRNKLFQGDCLDVLRTFPDGCVTAVVTDPPYGLSSQPDMKEVLKHWLAGDEYEHRGSGFMGKEWDSFVPGPKVWEEVMRVLKPGGHILSFSGTRTYDLMVTAMRLAGSEIRDKFDYFCEMEDYRAWMHGLAIPKSLNISKAVDAKIRCGGSDSQRLRQTEQETGGEEYQTRAPVNGLFGNMKSWKRKAWQPVTDEGKKWDGYGTALKPSHEPVAVFGKAADGVVPELPQTDVPFDYVVRVAQKERNLGCKHLFWRHNGTDYERISEDEYNRLTEENEKRKGEEGFKPYWVEQGNVHPTVKPIELMRYLVRLVKMPGTNLVLDPFMGSGTTGVACILEGCDCVGIEKDSVAFEIAKARLHYFKCLGKKGLK